MVLALGLQELLLVEPPQHQGQRIGGPGLVVAPRPCGFQVLPGLRLVPEREEALPQGVVARPLAQVTGLVHAGLQLAHPRADGLPVRAGVVRG